jgi:hypothetical protein
LKDMVTANKSCPVAYAYKDVKNLNKILGQHFGQK